MFEYCGFKEHVLWFFMLKPFPSLIYCLIPCWQLFIRHQERNSYSCQSNHMQHKRQKASLWILQRTFQKLISVHLRQQLAVSAVERNKRWLLFHPFKREVWKQHSWGKKKNLISTKIHILCVSSLAQEPSNLQRQNFPKVYESNFTGCFWFQGNIAGAPCPQREWCRMILDDSVHICQHQT